MKTATAPEDTTLVIVCRNNAGVAARLDAWRADHPRLAAVEIDCAGSLHPATVAYLATRFDGVVVSACPVENCAYRGGATVVDARILEGQRPAVPGRIAPGTVRVVHRSQGEWPALRAAITGGSGDGTAPRSGPGHATVRIAVAFAMTAALLSLVALGSRAPQGADPRHAVLRLGWRFTGQPAEICRDLDADELARRPVHMRVTRECHSEPLVYALEAAVDGRIVLQKTLRSPGLRGDRPLVVEEDLTLPPGDHDVRVTFAPAPPGRDGTVLAFDGRFRFEAGRVALVSTEGDTLVVR